MRARALMLKAIQSGGPHPENVAWCRATLSKMLLTEGALLPAKNEAEEAVLVARSNPKALVALGQVRMAEKKYDEATKAFEKSFAIQKTHEAMEPLVKLYKISGDTEKRVAMTKELISYHRHTHTHAGDLKAHSHAEEHVGKGSSQLALFLANEKIDLDEALAEGKRAYENFPNVYAADALAWCYFRNGDFKKAQLYSRRSLSQGTPDASLHYHAGMIAEGAGDLSGARKSLTTALSIHPNFDPIDTENARFALRRIFASQRAVQKK